MVSYGGATAALLFSKQRFTSSDSHHSSLRREYEQSDGSEAAVSQQQETDGLDVSSFTPFEEPKGFEDLEPRVSRIHVLGGGNIGKLVAHAIAGIPNPPPITLLFRSFKLLQLWRESDRSIEVVTDGKGEKRYGFEVEFLAPLERKNLPATPIEALREDFVVPPEDSPEKSHGANNPSDPGMIQQLVLAIDRRRTIFTLSMVADRLTRNSTIVFMQHGLGIVDEVNEKVFPNEMTRPSYLVGRVTHGLSTSTLNPFSVIHSDMGTVALGTPLRSSTLQMWTANDGLTNMIRSKLYVMRTLTRTPDLAAVCLFPIDFFQLQIEQLAVEAIIQPLTVLFDCKNGGLLHNGPASRVARLLLAEISLVIRSLPELQGIPNVNMRFSPKRLDSLIYGIIRSTAENISSMLQDVRAAKETNIMHINGYIVRRGEEMGMKCVMNYMLMEMVKAKLLIIKRVEDEVQ